MAPSLILTDRVFLDTAYAIALSSPTDQFHQLAVNVAEELEARGTRLVTTVAVLLEVGDALSKLSYRRSAADLLSSLRSDPTVEVVALSDQLLQEALALYSERPDKDWGITDCLSFVVMRTQNITEALTTDDHFQQAGFRVLLR